MLNGIETIFDNTTQMLRHLKKKSFEKNTQDFIDSYGTLFPGNDRICGQYFR